MHLSIDWYIMTEPLREISNNVVCATSKGSDQSATTRSLIRALASRLNILWVLIYWRDIIWSFLSEKEAAQARLRLHLSKYHIVWTQMSRLNCMSSNSNANDQGTMHLR